MLRVYTSPSCSSCRKVKVWLKTQKISFVEKNIFTSPLSEKELMEILSKSENGTEDIISNRSKIFKEKNVDFDALSLKEMIVFIQDNPSVLKRPIIVDDRRIQVGYDAEEIRTFIPAARRIAQLSCNPTDCEKYPTCAHRIFAKEE